LDFNLEARVLVDGGRRARAVGFARCGVVKRRVRPALVVEVEVGVELRVRVDQRHVTFQIDLLVFHRPPQPFDEDVVETSALAIHRQFHTERQERGSELRRRELAALVCVEDLGRAKSRDRRWTARTQKLASSVLDNSHASTWREILTPATRRRRPFDPRA